MDDALVQRFALTRPLIFENIDKGHEVITKSTRTIIRSDQESLEKDLPEMLSIAKLAEYDPLLGTFYSQQHPTEREKEYFRHFFDLCSPLRNAWSWRTMRRTVPDVYESEIADLLHLWERLHGQEVTNQPAFGHMAGGAVNIDSTKIRSEALGVWAILRENPKYNVTLQLTGDRDYLPTWQRYIDVLIQIITNCSTPDPLLYTILPDITETDYRVRIVALGNGIRGYDIRKRERSGIGGGTYSGKVR